MDRDTLFYQLLIQAALPLWKAGNDTDEIAYKLRLAGILADEGSVANALARWRDEQATARAA